MSNPDLVPYGRASRLRAAIASLAAEMAESARSMVPTDADEHARSGELAADAAALAADARELLRLAVAYERRRGTSWEVLGGALGLNSRQAAQDRYGDAVKQLDDLLIECWLLGDDPRYPGMPEGAADTAETAGRLDRWVDLHLMDYDPLAHKAADDPDRVRPVSGNLKPLDSLEFSAMLSAAAALVTDAQARQLELGLARRKVEFHERLLADDLAGKRTRADVDQTRDLLAAARIRLAELEEAEAIRTALEQGRD